MEYQASQKFLLRSLNVHLVQLSLKLEQMVFQLVPPKLESLLVMVFESRLL